MNYEFLRELLESYSPSGNERASVEIWSKAMEEIGAKLYYNDSMGNVAYSIGKGNTKVLLSGHIDEVNARVNYISDNGLISIINSGGICKKSLLASHVTILGSKGNINGVVEKKPIHCEIKDEVDKVDDITTFKINVGFESREAVLNMGIHPGCHVVYPRNTIMNFGENQICSQGLDDKIGVFITYEIMKRIVELNDDYIFNTYTIIGLAAVQEETGLRGATVAAKNINSDISFDFDVTFATDGENGMSKEKYGDIRLGKGAVVQYGADKNEILNQLLTETAVNRNIPFQYGATRCGGTNTNAIQLHSKDCKTTLISIPNRNMHTPVEVVDKRDVKSAVDLVVGAIYNYY